MSQTVALALAASDGWIAGQTRQPDDVVAVPGDAIAAFRRALALSCDWVWVVGPEIEPAPDALAALLDAVDELPTPRPVALSSVVFGRDGQPCEPALPDGHWFRVAEAVAAAEHRAMLMREAPFASLLLHRETATSESLPDPGRYGPMADREYMGRLLRHHYGHMVSQSTATATCDMPYPHPWSRAQLLRSRAWTRAERVRLVGLATRDARRLLRGVR